MKLRQQVESMSDERILARQHAREHKEFMDKIKTCVEKRDEEGILKETNNYYTHWSKLGEERCAAADLHLEQLKMLLLPTQVRLQLACEVDVKDVPVVHGPGGRVL